MTHRLLLTVGACVLGALLASPALAADSAGGAVFDASSVNYEPPKTIRRGGFAMGVSSGLGLGSYRGYPLEVDALNDPEGQQSTGPAFATQLNVWLGGSLRDFLTFGLGVGLTSGTASDRGVMSAVLFRVEAYPFFSRGGVFQDLGLSFDGGLGLAFMNEGEETAYEDRIADGGAMSTLALGVFWEPIRFWHVSGGPAVTYLRAFSQTMNIDQVTVGMRWALYGDHPKRKAKPEVAFGGP